MAAGLLIGASLAVGASYLIRGILYGLNTVDAFFPLLFLGISLLAAYLPAQRNPSQYLKQRFELDFQLHGFFHLTNK